MELESRYKRCLDCAYILDGLPEHRCPECGRPFDPDDPDSYTVQSPRAPWSTVGIVIVTLASAHLLLLAVSTFDVGCRIPGEWYPLGGCKLDYTGMIAALTSPVVLVACALVRRRVIWLGIIDLLLGLIWGASVVRLLGYL